MFGTHTVAVAVADPDYASIARITALQARYRADAAGGVGPGGRGVIGYDRGDATRSWGGPVYTVPQPTAAYAAIGTPSGIYVDPAIAQDQLSASPALSPFQQTLYARMIGGQQ